jgi:hypothetical protein
MCCLFTTLVMAGPRAAIVIWWLLQPARWNAAFDTFIWPMLGFLFFPFTTLMYVLMAPGGIDGFEPVWLVIAVVLDVVSWTGGAYGNRGRVTSTYQG